MQLQLIIYKEFYNWLKEEQHSKCYKQLLLNSKLNMGNYNLDNILRLS
jgi:hypothetical protein